MNQESAFNFLTQFFTKLSSIEEPFVLEDFCEDKLSIHHKEKIFSKAEFDNLLQWRRKNIERLYFEIEDFVMVDSLCVSIVRLIWIEKNNKNYHELELNLVCKLKEWKTCEIWLMLDAEMAFNTEISLKNKNDFMRRLSTHHSFYEGQWEKLTETEKECLYYYLNGFSAKEASQEMALTYRTIETYIANIKVKYDCATRTELRGIFS